MPQAKVAELVDALDLGSSGVTRGGSSPSFRTRHTRADLSFRTGFNGMQVSLTATGGLERRLEVAVPAQAVTSEIETRLQQLARTTRLKGFRLGKAPLPVVRRMYGEQVRAEVVNDLLRSSFAEAVSKEQLKPVAGPRIEPIAMDPGADLKYAAVFEVMPEVKVAPFEGIHVQRPSPPT